MYLRDEAALSYVLGVILLAFPWLGVMWGIWGFFWTLIMLFAVFVVGLRRGMKWASVLSVIGYLAPLIGLGTSSLASMSLVPLAGLFAVYGWNRWPGRITFFWSSVLASLLGTIPLFFSVGQGVDANSVSGLINAIMQQYQASGLVDAMQQEGITAAQLRQLIQQFIEFYVLIIPSLAVLGSLFEYSIVFYVLKRWLNPEGRVPFSRWRLPWYAVWGAVLGIGFYLLGDQFSWLPLRGLGINLMVIFGAVALILGIAVYSYLLKSPRIPRLLKWILVLASIIYLFFSVASITLFGLFDLLFNFRRLPEET